MYSYYKTRKRNKALFRLIGLVIIVGTLSFLFFNFKQYIFFWKYTQHRIAKEISEAMNTRSPEEREKLLRNIASKCEDLDGDNQLSPEAFFLAGEANCLLGEALIGRAFSETIIHDGVSVKLGDSSREHFLAAIRCVNKGRALSDKADPRNALVLAKAGFYTGYYGREKLRSITEEMGEDPPLQDIDDARFCALMYILAGNNEKGFQILLEHGRTADTLEGGLLRASMYAIAKQNTNAILGFREILEKTSDSATLKIVHLNLGKLYYAQSLFNESLKHFTSALEIDERDYLLKIWIGKNYSAMGNRAKARAIWSEVLVADSGNEEAKRLLGPM